MLGSDCSMILVILNMLHSPGGYLDLSRLQKNCISLDYRRKIYKPRVLRNFCYTKKTKKNFVDNLVESPSGMNRAG